MKILGSDVNCWVCSDLKTWNCRSLRLYHLYRNGLEWKSKKKINRNCSLQYCETVVHTQGCRVALITQAFFPPFCEITITMSPALFLLIWARGGGKKASQQQGSFWSMLHFVFAALKEVLTFWSHSSVYTNKSAGFQKHSSQVHGLLYREQM